MSKDLKALTTLLDNLPGVHYDVDHSARYAQGNNGRRHRTITPPLTKIVTVRKMDGSKHSVLHFDGAGKLKKADR